MTVYGNVVWRQHSTSPRNVNELRRANFRRVIVSYGTRFVSLSPGAQATINAVTYISRMPAASPP